MSLQAASSVATDDTAPEPAEGGADGAEASWEKARSDYPRGAVTGIFLIMLVGALYFAADVFMPIAVAIVLALTLKPIVRFLEKKRIPAAATSVVLALLITGAGALAATALIEPITDLVDSAPRIRAELTEKLKSIRQPVEAVMEAREEVENVTGGAAGSDNVQAVTVEGPGILASAASSVISGLTTLVVIFVLVIFLLASGDMFYEKLVRSFDKMADKKRALRTAYDIQREVSRYLLTITIINAGLGVAVGTGLYFLGMPEPHIWGVIAAVANFIPYIGAVLGMAAAGMVAVVTFDTLGAALLIPGFYFLCTFLEGQFITPLVVGKRLQINAVVIFISVAFWAWLWGLVGALLAVPILVIIKTLCSHYPALNTIADFLSDEAHEDPDVDTIQSPQPAE